jgi:ElaB/YqjD/DUF883 family membrane-anchored ribosome-binding protein
MSMENPTNSLTPDLSTASKTKAKISKTADGIADRAESKITDLARKAEEAARRAETVLHDGVETLRAQSRVYADQAVQKFESAQVAVREQVRERPITGILAAAGVGFLLGLLVARRR